MAANFLQRRPRLAYPFTILTEPGIVRLVAGEDYRYSLTAPGLETWLPAFLQRLDGKETLNNLVATLTPSQREAATQIVQHLYGERALIDGSALDAHAPRKLNVTLAGTGKLIERLSGRFTAQLAADASGVVLLSQDRLDYEEALIHNRQCRASGTGFLWASHGPLNRAYVSPLFLPDAGPCFGCLLRAFQRLSPAPELYDALRRHSQAQKPIEPVEFPEEGLLILQGLIEWKLGEAERPDPDPALYRLHVLERQHFEVSTHRVFADPACGECHVG